MSSLLEGILARLEPEHARALEWFAANEGTVGPRPWRQDGQSVVPGLSIPLVAQRGIHQPAGWSCAVSITATSGRAYLDGKPQRLDDGTWVLPYRAHGGGDGSGLDSRWNRALLVNMSDRIPLGVFVHARGSAYRNLGLAMVEEYYEDQGTFLLRGPVAHPQSFALWEGEPTEWEPVVLAAESNDDSDTRVPTLARLRTAQDRFRETLLDAYSRRCAVTGYEAEPALQAAHILGYRGGSSQQVRNGLLLRADVHLLYDRHLLSVEPTEGCVWLADSLCSTAYGDLQGKPIRLPVDGEKRPDPERLAVHFAVFSGSGG